MNRTLTLVLVGFVALLGAFIFFIEPRLKSTRAVKESGGALLSFDPDAVSAIRVRKGSEELVLGKEADDWQIEQPLVDNASPGLVQQMLSGLLFLKPLDVIQERELPNGEESLKEYGLDVEAESVAFDTDKEPEKKILFGKEFQDRVYARFAGSLTVYLLPKTFKDFFFRPVDDYRDRRLSAWSPDDIKQLTIRRAGGELEVARQRDDWAIVKPLRAPADAEKIRILLSKLLSAQILKFVDGKASLNTGLASPQLEVVLSGSDDQSHTLKIGAKADGGLVYASFAPRPGVFEVSADLLDALSVSPDSLRQRDLMQVNFDTVDRLTFMQGGRRIIVARDEDDWVLLPGKERVDSKEVTELIRVLEEATVERFVSPTAEDLNRFGLEAPAVTLTLSAWLSENTAEEAEGETPIVSLAFGNQQDDLVYVSKDSGDEVYLTGSRVLAKLLVFLDGLSKGAPQNTEVPAQPEKQTVQPQ